MCYLSHFYTDVMLNIKKSTLRASGVAVLLIAAAAPAAADQVLAGAKSCLACHSATSKVVGPAFRDIAQRYKGTPDADALLASRIVKGSNGNWGPTPMPPQTQVTDGEARRLAQWLLSTN